MKLQGSAVKKLPKNKKKKMKKTLEDMTNTRNEDSTRLRKIIDEQLAYLKIQQQNAVKIESNLIKQLEDVRKKALRVEGAILGLNNILVKADKKEEKK